MSFADYGENFVMEAIFEADASWPTNYYVALFTTAHGEDGTGGTEVTGGSYAREAVARGAAAWTVTADTVTNDAAIDFGTATADWGIITDAGLYDAITAGNLFALFVLSASKTVNNGDSFQFAASNFSLTLD